MHDREFCFDFSRKILLIFQTKKTITISCFYFDKSIELKKLYKNEKIIATKTTLIKIYKVEKTLFIVLIIVAKFEKKEKKIDDDDDV